MFKSVQLRIILIIMVLAILTLLGYGLFSIQTIRTAQANELYIRQCTILLLVFIISFIIISLVILWFTSKMITKPIYKLIKSAEEITENDEKKSKLYSTKRNSEIDDLINTFENMTKGLKENLNEITRQKRQIETILQYMTDGIVAFNISGEIIHVNPAATKLLGMKLDKNIEFKQIFEKIDPEINLEKIIYLEDWAISEKRIEINDKYLKIFFAPFKNELDKPAGVIALIQDITEHVKLDNMRKEFIADVSHELKTPLTSIMGYTETLATSEYDPEMQEKFLKVISSETIRMTKLVSDLLTLSKYDNTGTNWEKIEFDLGELVKSCQENLQIEIDKKKQKVECFVTANVPKVFADKDGIERVILNILSNSIKYTDIEGTIKIYVGFVYNDAYIKIIDNGIGIPEKDLERIFERFYRVDKARTRKMGGTGLRSFYRKRSIRQK